MANPIDTKPSKTTHPLAKMRDIAISLAWEVRVAKIQALAQHPVNAMFEAIEAIDGEYQIKVNQINGLYRELKEGYNLNKYST